MISTILKKIRNIFKKNDIKIEYSMHEKIQMIIETRKPYKNAFGSTIPPFEPGIYTGMYGACRGCQEYSWLYWNSIRPEIFKEICLRKDYFVTEHISAYCDIFFFDYSDFFYTENIFSDRYLIKIMPWEGWKNVKIDWENTGYKRL